jgi:predicted DNA-binding transcriptional regulator AlpA
MPDTIQTETPDPLLSGPALRQLLSVCAMTHHRWVQAGKFPPPDLRINGRKYWREGTYARWIADQAKIEAVRRSGENG